MYTTISKIMFASSLCLYAVNALSSQPETNRDKNEQFKITRWLNHGLVTVLARHPEFTPSEQEQVKNNFSLIKKDTLGRLKFLQGNFRYLAQCDREKGQADLAVCAQLFKSGQLSSQSMMDCVREINASEQALENLRNQQISRHFPAVNMPFAPVRQQKSAVPCTRG